MSRPSVITIDHGGGATGTMGVTESLVGQALNYLVNWGAMPGTRARAGIAGRFEVGANPITLRVRVGLAGAHNDAPAGTVVAEVVLPANTTTDVGVLGDEFAYPTAAGGITRAMLTAQAPGGDSIWTATQPCITFTPTDSAARAVLVGGNPFIYGSPVWLVDFDAFEGAAELVVGLAYAVNNPGTTHRIYLGGTEGSSPGPGFMDPAEDGVLALTTVASGTRAGAIATIANTLGGPQFVKLSLGDLVGDASLLIREA